MPNECELQALLDPSTHAALEAVACFQTDLQAYTRHQSRIRRLLHGNWFHHHITLAAELAKIEDPEIILATAMKKLPLNAHLGGTLGRMLNDLSHTINGYSFNQYREKFWDSQHADQAFVTSAKAALSELYWQSYAKKNNKVKLFFLSRHHTDIAQNIKTWCQDDQLTVKDIIVNIDQAFTAKGGQKVKTGGLFYQSLENFCQRYFGLNFNKLMIQASGPIKVPNLNRS